MFASETSHARTSPNSCSRFARSPVRSAFASSPTSSVSHRKVASRPRVSVALEVGGAQRRLQVGEVHGESLRGVGAEATLRRTAPCSDSACDGRRRRPEELFEHLLERRPPAGPCALATFAKGEVVFHEEDPGDSIHLIEKGMFAVRDEHHGGRT